MQRCWVTVAETSPTGLAMSVTVTDIGVAPFTSASTAWRSAQTSAAAILGPAAAEGLRVRVPVFQMGRGDLWQTCDVSGLYLEAIHRGTWWPGR